MKSVFSQHVVWWSRKKRKGPLSWNWVVQRCTQHTPWQLGMPEKEAMGVEFQCFWCPNMGFQKWRYVPPNEWFRMGNPIKVDDLEVPLFQETPKYGNIKLGDRSRYTKSGTGIWYGVKLGNIEYTRSFAYLEIHDRVEANNASKTPMHITKFAMYWTSAMRDNNPSFLLPNQFRLDTLISNWSPVKKKKNS